MSTINDFIRWPETSKKVINYFSHLLKVPRDDLKMVKGLKKHDKTLSIPEKYMKFNEVNNIV